MQESSILQGRFWRHFLAFRPRSELRELYWFSLLFSFAGALITIFEPIFLYQEGFSFARIALYYALHYTLYVVLMPLGGKFSSRFGLERSLAVATPLFVLYFLVLSLLPVWNQLYWVALVLLTFFKIFYWPAYHAEFAKYGDGNNRGTELSWVYMITYGVGILGPLFGGLIATYAGFPTLFVLAAAVALVAGVPLLRTKEHYHVRDFSYSSPWKILFSKKHRKMAVGMLGWGEDLIDLVAWPLFMFLLLGSADKLGFVASFSIVIMTAMGFVVGEMSDRFPRRDLIRLHLPFLILGFLLRPFSYSPIRIVLTDVLARVAHIGVIIPMWSYIYTRARPAGAVKYILAAEMSLAATKAVTAFTMVLIFSQFLPFTAFLLIFSLASVLTLFYLSF